MSSQTREPLPMQPIELDAAGVIRFRCNRIVRMLLDAGPYDLNKIVLMPFDGDEFEQFYQLIGYSVSGYGDLPDTSEESVAEADRRSEALMAAAKLHDE